MENNINTCPQLMENFDDVRKSVTYHADLWGDHFLQYASLASSETSEAEEEIIKEHKRQTEKVREMLNNNDHEILELIDVLQRLGVAYHFHNEVEKSLQMVYENYMTVIIKNNQVADDNLHTAALRFRLLRQKAYHVSPEDALGKFKGLEGKFQAKKDDAQGLLSLYEASHFRVHGEQILDDALEFSSSCLKESLNVMSISKSLKRKVNEALKFPITKSLPRIAARKFISMYEEDESYDEMLLNFAKLDYNLLQKKHQKELGDLARWRKALNYADEYSFARNRVVECYFWASAISFEPEFHFERIMIAKIIDAITIIDDIYDVYGSLDDLRLFTDAAQRWDVSAMEQLPPYMRRCYQTLLDIYAELEDYERAETVGETFRTQFAKEEIIRMTCAYMVEAKWLYTKYKPTMEEYMKLGQTTAGQIMFITSSFPCLGDLVKFEEAEFIATKNPLIMQATNVVARLMDDIAGHGFETRISAVDCYMTENGCSKEVACHELEMQVSKAWKDINEECLRRKAFISEPILGRILNLSRIVYFLYWDKDEFTDSRKTMKEAIRDLFVEPIPL